VAHKGPQIGKIGSVEEAMLDDDFPEYLSSIGPALPKSVNGADGSRWREKAVVLGAAAYMLLLYWFDIDFDLGVGLLVVVGLIVFGIRHLLGKSGSLEMSWLAYHYNRQWICLKCKHHWAEQKKLKEKATELS